MIEIERKFLLKNTNFKKEAFDQHHIKQGFLSTHKKRTVRVRIQDDQAFLTVKGQSSKDGLMRFEWEREIGNKEAENLLKLCKNSIIDKVRYKVKVDNHVFEVDEFFGDNEGLLIAEVELNSIDETFSKPNWLGKEVTGKKKYYNSRLSIKPFKTWKNKLT